MNTTNELPSNQSACAACKYQRKKCPSNCILRRHFPASKVEVFVAVHKIFGVANVTKMLRKAKSLADQDEIAKSLYWEAMSWAHDPIRGPYGYHLRLRDNVRVLQEHVNRQRLLLPINNKANMPAINDFCGNKKIVGPDEDLKSPLSYAGLATPFEKIEINSGHDYVNNNCNQPSVISDYVPRVSWDVFGPENEVTWHWQQHNYRSPKHELDNVKWYNYNSSEQL